MRLTEERNSNNRDHSTMNEAEERREIANEIMENIQNDVIGVNQEIDLVEPIM